MKIRSIIATLALLVAGCDSGVLNPHGPVGAAEKTILINSLAIMLAIVIPTIIGTLAMAWWFRATNKRARYRPEFTFSGQVELVVWAVPAMVVILLGGIAWIGSHDLEPSKPLRSSVQSVTVEVVSLDWKWLFIYPDQGVASVNKLVVPAGTPIVFKLTSGSVMNSFFVPQLGSQIYTMAGMATRLHLQADEPGSYAGISAQYSGAGFSDMGFTLKAVAPSEFDAWIASVKGHEQTLDADRYAMLAQPSKKVEAHDYGGVMPGLFDGIVSMKASHHTHAGASAAAHSER